MIHLRDSRCRIDRLAGWVLATVVLVFGPRARANPFVQPEIEIDCVSQYVDMPSPLVWDVLPYEDVIFQVKIVDAAVASGKAVKVHAQTANTLHATEFQTIATVTFTEGVHSMPLRGYALLSVDSTVHLGRFLRWQVEFTHADPTQSITFGATVVGKR